MIKTEKMKKKNRQERDEEKTREKRERERDRENERERERIRETEKRNEKGGERERSLARFSRSRRASDRSRLFHFQREFMAMLGATGCSRYSSASVTSIFHSLSLSLTSLSVSLFYRSE